MTRSHLLLAAAAILASAACNAEKGGGSGGTQAQAQVAKPPAGGWTQSVTRTEQGGYLLGNPNAQVKLVEFGSLSCSHCAEFSHESDKPLRDRYIKDGRVSFEFRPYMRNGLDIAATLIAACNGPKGFFPLAHAMYADQKNWLGKISADQAGQQAIQAMSPEQQIPAFAKLAGLDRFGAQRGVPSAKSTQCLADQNQVSALVQQTSDANSSYELAGTPTFLINDKVVEGAATWGTLEPKLKEALGS